MSRTRNRGKSANKAAPHSGEKPNNNKGGRYESEGKRSEGKSGSEEGSDRGSGSESSSKEISSGSSIPSSRNDPEWYSRDPRLVVDAASIPFSKPFGDFIDLLKPSTVLPGTNSVASTFINATEPGVCSLVLKPSFGYAGDKTAPINVCANALYTHVRYVNNGRKNYDPVDLMIYTGAFGDIYSFVAWCIRLYQYAFMYSQRNWYIGKDLILANHVDADNLIANLANFRYWINSIINKISSFALPGDIYFFKRRVFLYSNVYLENSYSNIKDQLYQLVPEGFYAFDFDTRGAGKLSYQPLRISGTLMDINYLQVYFEAVLMANITGDEDFGLMSGDILKAYGDNILRIAQIGEEGGIMPVHDPYVLSQFKNAFVWDTYRADPSKTFLDPNGDSHVFGDLEQSTNGLLVACESCDWNTNAVACAYGAGNKVITVENPDPNPGDVLEATRLMPFLGLYPDNSGSGTYFYAMMGGTELAVGAKISMRPASNGTDTTRIVGTQFHYGSSLGLVNSIMLSSFKYAPMSWRINVSGTSVTEFNVLSNLDNYTLIDNDILKRIHDVAMLSLFYVPGVAKIVS